MYNKLFYGSVISYCTNDKYLIFYKNIVSALEIFLYRKDFTNIYETNSEQNFVGHTIFSFRKTGKVCVYIPIYYLSIKF